MFEPRLALASLSGEADADWALAAADHAGAAFLGGIALDDPSREAARKLVARDREEFLPPDPLAFIDNQLSRVATDTEAEIRPGINIRSTTAEPIREAAAICADYEAIVEINAHCRQDELCAVGCGESLLADSNRLAEYVTVAAEEGATVSVKVRAEVDGVDLVAVGERIEAAGADAIHIDAMDSEAVVSDFADATDLFVIANNEVRDADSVREYFGYGADAVSVGRPSREPDGPVLRRVADAVAAHTTEPNP
ncbi:dihydropyrimidine dehydrogenase [Halonotius terrestris]|uniref:Dihydropyrimidine dehydrogenase n=1 Tax=Halonotius terrestris TaxID=2487750 RepID=A0A8J8TD11_9EURY|nr:tRNA-dihydrouridine synthase [Halonotius terrestris]TQQ82953.1 dihydropyrimidine dehydrogenase [Halonotius terrestris]